MDAERSNRGLTVSSLAAILLGLLTASILTQIYDLILGVPFSSEHTLALPVIWTLGLLALVGMLVKVLCRVHVLGRAEWLCVCYVMLLAAPLMTQGFWHRAVAILATNPRQGDFEKLDAMNDRLWPHGPNLLADAWDESADPAPIRQGQCTWELAEVDAGKSAPVPVLVNTGRDARSSISIRLPLTAVEGRHAPMPGEPYLISVLARARDLGPGAYYYCRFYSDSESRFTEAFLASTPERVTVLHKTGFQRVGAYGVKFGQTAREAVTVEFGLQGIGRLELHDPKLVSVGALENLYRGKQVVTASEAAALTPYERADLLVRPDRLLSRDGLRYLIAGYIPIADWTEPLLAWTAFIGLVLLATLMVNMIMRKQWMENERFLMPVTRIPLALIGEDSEDGQRRPPLWKNRLMWTGFAVALAFMMLRTWASLNPKVPDPSINIPLQAYLSDPGWGQTWAGMRFDVDPIFLAMCIFMELNVLLSLVLGVFLFRAQYGLGHVTGLTADPRFPYVEQQVTWSYLAYAAMILIFTRKYFWRVLKTLVLGDRGGEHGEAWTYRVAVPVLALTWVGVTYWARWMGLAPSGMYLFFGFLLTVGFVASRLRAECGAPWGYFAPANLAILAVMLGGVSTFGPEVLLFCFLASFMLGPTVFFQIPGTQLELLELGRRWQVRPWELVLCALLGVVGGMVLGGWVFLSNAYAVGGNAMRYQWAFGTKWWYFFPFNQDLQVATRAFLGETAAVSDAGIDRAWLASAWAAGWTVIVTTLRQFWAGFWFHPIGVVLGGTGFMRYIWGSALVAWGIRTVVVRIGGAAAVRNKLQPFFVGVFLGSATAYLLGGVLAAMLQAVGVEWVPPTLVSP